MAIKTGNNKTAAETNTVAQTQATQPFPTETKAEKSNKALRISDLMNAFVRVGGLDAEAEAYFARIDHILAENKSVIAVTSEPIVTPTAAGRLYLDSTKENGVVLVAASSCNLMDHQVPSDTINAFREQLVMKHGDKAKIYQFIVVTPDDYGKVDVMGATILNLFRALDVTQAVDINMLGYNNFTIITRKDRVDEFMRKMSPHGVPARSDYGLVICLNNGYQRGPNGVMEPQLTPLAGVSAYTRFLTPGDNAGMIQDYRFIPIVTITDIISCLPDKTILPLILSIAARTFITCAGWQRQFQTFVKDQPNLGALLSDPQTGAPWTIETREQLNSFLNQYTAPALLGIDIAIGRASIAGLDILFSSNPEETAKFFGKFFPKTWDKDIPCPYLWGAWNVQGTYSDGGVIKDTRSIDYLSLVPRMNNNTAAIRPLLSQSVNRDWFLDYVRKNIYTENVHAYYNVASLALRSLFVKALCEALNVSGITINDDIGTATEIPLSNLFATQQDNYINMTLGRGPQMSFHGGMFGGW